MAALAAVLLCCCRPAPADASSVLIAFAPERLDGRAELSFGVMSATQGKYSIRQTLLDMTQGSRLSISGYDPQSPPTVTLAGDRIEGWDEVLARARSAPATVIPGLLAQSVPGGAAYAGIDGDWNVEALLAADRSGRIGAVSLGPAGDVAARAQTLLRRHRLVIADLHGSAQLDELVRERARDEALLVIRTPPRSDAPQLLHTGAIGLGEAAPGLLRSATTRRDGFITAIDVLPTVMKQLGLAVPRDVHGRAISAGGKRDIGYVRRLDRRLRVVSTRRFVTLYWLLAGLAALGLTALAQPRARRWALRTAGLGLLWVPALTLLTAALAPHRTAEGVIVGLGSLALGALTDAAVRWPRAPAVPALTAVVIYLADLAAGSTLIVRSLLGPNPRFGARFYGIGNEIEALLPVLALVGIAAAAGAARRSRALAATIAGAMLVLGVFVGAGRLGADVGGVITVAAAGAAATVAALPGGVSRRAIAIACAVPILGLGALALIDTVTGGDSHFTSTILHADSAGSLWDVVKRRTSLAASAFARGLMPLCTLAAIALVVTGIRRRQRIYAAVADRPAWAAALAGGTAGGVIGSLANDSGPVLLVLAVCGLLASTAYLRGRGGV